MKAKQTAASSFKRKPRKKLGRHRKYRGKSYKAYRGQGR